jgi:hypothetical protein
MEPTQIAAIASAISGFLSGGIVYWLTRESKSDLIIHSLKQEELGLKHCGREVSHIFTFKKDRRVNLAKIEHARSAEKKAELESKIQDVQAEVKSLNKRLDKVLDMIQQQETIGQRDIISQNEFTFPAMQISTELHNLAALLNQYAFESSRVRFFGQVKGGDLRGRVLANLIDREDPGRIQRTKISEFIDAQMEMVKMKTSTAEKLEERFLLPVTES